MPRHHPFPLRLLRPALRDQPRARVFLYALSGSATVATVYSVGALFWGPGDPVGNASNLAAMAFLLLTTWHFCRTGDYARSLLLVHVPVILIVVWNATRHGGVAAPDLGWVMLLNVTGVLFGGTALGLWELLFVESLFLALFLAQSAGWVTPDNLPPRPGPVYHWFVLTLVSSLTVALVAHFNRTMERTRRDLDAMRRRRIAELDELVARRTAELAGVRAEIARDFHDEVGNTLSGIALMAEQVRLDHPDLPERSRNLLERVAHQSHQVHRQARDFVWAIDPRSDTLGEVLLQALQQAEGLVSSAGLELRVDDDLPDDWFRIDLGPGKGRHLLLALKEAVGNAARHGTGERVHLGFSREGDRARIRVSNPGEPFDPLVRSGHGLENIRRRASMLDSEVSHRFEPDGLVALELALRLPRSGGGEETETVAA